eukprot:5281726-Pleurochrysis_carterae.AAC.3
MRSYVNVYGKEAISPSLSQPFPFTMLISICALRDADYVGNEVRNPSLNRVNIVGLTLLKVMWRTGHRLGEAVKTSDKLSYFVRADVTYCIAGRVVVDPTPEDL